MSKYKTLNNILESLRQEAPESYKRYHNDTTQERINYAKSLAYIHLYLKASFNISDFNERENYITDGPEDGGIDAYYIDHETRTIYFIQSKYRTTENNFEDKGIDINELSSMDINRIAEGETQSEEGKNYSSKIINMQRNISEIEQLSRYDFKVIILANVLKYSNVTLKRILGLPFEIFNFKRAYEELVFPVLRGTCHVAKDITVSLNIGSKKNITMDYEVINNDSSISVQLFFIPTLEIAKIMSEYKNSILEYNPRSYLGISSNTVNPMIKNSIIAKDNNMFSLFNNGITMLSDDTEHTKKTGKKGLAHLDITNPQIINGGQTAHTLATIYENQEIDNKVFEGKEVLTKIITFDEGFKKDSSKIGLIEELSLATNQQSVVTEADRRSNDKVQIEIQNYFYNEFGYCYHRKSGEFKEGLENGYIKKEQIIDRGSLLRIAYATNGKVAKSRRNSVEHLFSPGNFENELNISSDYRKLFYGYLVYNKLNELEKESKLTSDKFYIERYGNSLRYGKFAVVSIVTGFYDNQLDNSQLDKHADEKLAKVLDQWTAFEQHQLKQDSNNQYFKRYVDEKGVENLEYNYDGYYKGRTIDNDLENYDFNT